MGRGINPGDAWDDPADLLIRADLARPQPMARLVQGDVGSGKTVVALASLLCAIEAGCQGALMAPTEVLAEQHYRKLGEWLPQLHVSSALLTGSTPATRRRALLQDLANGQLQLLVGTHADHQTISLIATFSRSVSLLK